MKRYADPNNIRTVYIYALCEPDTEEIRYIGQTVHCEGRYLQHLYDEPGKQNPKTIWVQSLRKQGKKPIMLVLEVVTSETSDAAEKKWTRRYRDNGCNLTNLK